MQFLLGNCPPVCALSTPWFGHYWWSATSMWTLIKWPAVWVSLTKEFQNSQIHPPPINELEKQIPVARGRASSPVDWEWSSPQLRARLSQLFRSASRLSTEAPLSSPSKRLSAVENWMPGAALSPRCLSHLGLRELPATHLPFFGAYLLHAICCSVFSHCNEEFTI